MLKVKPEIEAKIFLSGEFEDAETDSTNEDSLTMKMPMPGQKQNFDQSLDVQTVQPKTEFKPKVFYSVRQPVSGKSQRLK